MHENQKIVSEWLSQAGKSVGHALSLGEDGHCTIAFANEMQCMVEVADDSDVVFMYVPLLHLPEDTDQQVHLLKFALELNLFGLQTGGAVVSYDQRTDHLILTFSARIDLLDAQILGRALGDIMDVAVLLNDKMVAFEQTLVQQTASSAAFDVNVVRV